MQHVIMIVDDEPPVRELLMDAFALEPWEVLCAGTAEEALDILAREPVDVVVSDEKMPGMSGSEFLAVVRQQYPDTIRMILTGHASLESAIRAINEGEIYRFFTKPCNMVDLIVTIRQALQQKELMDENQRLKKKDRAIRGHWCYRCFGGVLYKKEYFSSLWSELDSGRMHCRRSIRACG